MPDTTLHVDELVDAALRSAPGGADPSFGPDTWREGLDVLVASANDEARLNRLGHLTLRTQIERSLGNRIGVERAVAAEPAIATRPISAPVFILGLPRTGTTLLSYLLDRDPANRSLLRGECLTSTPPPETATLRSDPRIATAQAEMDALYAVLPEFKAIHYEEGAGPTECITVLGQGFRSVHFETMAHLPSYSRWHLSCDMVPAYRWHERVLQVLQWRAPGRWVLKSPCHNLSLDALLTVYPDARFVVPHRDPVVAITSMADLVAVLAGLGTDGDWDHYIGEHWLELCGRMLDGLQRTRADESDGAFFDLAYRELVADPLGTVGRLYDWLGWPLTAEAETAMRQYLTSAPAGRFGHHRYDAARFGLDPDRVRHRVSAYEARFAAYL